MSERAPIVAPFHRPDLSTQVEHIFDDVGSPSYDGNMDPLLGLEEAVATLREVWAAGADAAPPAPELGRERLMAVTEALSTVSRHLGGLRSEVAAEVARESRPELGSDSLARQNGFRNAATLIAASTGVSTGEAVRLVAVGEAIAPRTSLTGETMPAKHPFVAEAVKSGRLGPDAASAIIRMLGRVSVRADREALERAEKTLVAQAPGLTLDQLGKVLLRAEAHLDPDGVEPKERDARGERKLVMFERDGMVHLTAALDPESAAPIKTAIEAIVTAEFRAASDRNALDEDHRSLPQRQADALALVCEHYLACDDADVPLGGATVIVRVTLADLESGAGHATVDGIAQPISISAARRMAAGGKVIPAVLGPRSEILDWGREKRLFTRAQKLALAERDGGCAGCGLPPGMCKVHHIRWWAKDAGPTDLSNGVLLCESCHHRIHDNGWEIRVDGVGVDARVRFIPPPHVDVTRTPRLGGRARYDFVAA